MADPGAFDECHISLRVVNCIENDRQLYPVQSYKRLKIKRKHYHRSSHTHIPYLNFSYKYYI
jgi:hypothetical protein